MTKLKRDNVGRPDSCPVPERVWKKLGEIQKRTGEDVLALDEALLHQLGFTAKDFGENVKELRDALDRLGEYRYLWEKGQRLWGREDAPRAYMGVVLSPDLLEAYNDSRGSTASNDKCL